LFNKTAFASLAVLVVFLAAWEWLPGLFGIPPFILPPASRTWNEFLRMLGSDRLLWHSGITSLEVIVGFFLGSVLGMVIGYILGVSPRAEVVPSRRFSSCGSASRCTRRSWSRS